MDAFEKICTDMHQIYIAKNHDYGDSFGQSCDEFGVVAAIVRLNDKMNRLKSLVIKKDQLVNDESLLDTLTDMANYAIMTKMWLEKYNDLSNK